MRSRPNETPRPALDAPAVGLLLALIDLQLGPRTGPGASRAAAGRFVDRRRGPHRAPRG
jgi:hypothetical protein